MKEISDDTQVEITGLKNYSIDMCGNVWNMKEKRLVRKYKSCEGRYILVDEKKHYIKDLLSVTFDKEVCVKPLKINISELMYKIFPKTYKKLLKQNGIKIKKFKRKLIRHKKERSN